MPDPHAGARSLTAADFTAAEAHAIKNAVRQATEQGRPVSRPASPSRILLSSGPRSPGSEPKSQGPPGRWPSSARRLRSCAPNSAPKSLLSAQRPPRYRTEIATLDTHARSTQIADRATRLSTPDRRPADRTTDRTHRCPLRDCRPRDRLVRWTVSAGRRNPATLRVKEVSPSAGGRW